MKPTIWKGKFLAYRQTTERRKKKLVKVEQRFQVRAPSREAAMDAVAGTINEYSNLLYPSFIFGGPKQAMSFTVSTALHNAGPEEA